MRTPRLKPAPYGTRMRLLIPLAVAIVLTPAVSADDSEWLESATVSGAKDGVLRLGY